MEKIASMFGSKVNSCLCPSSNPATATHFACWLKTQKRPSESKDETERESKRANTEETKTVWAFVLEEDEWDSTKYKIAIDLAEYPCERNVGNLEQAVKVETERMGFNVPARIRIFDKLPFVEDEVEEDNYATTYHLRQQVKAVSKRKAVADSDRSDVFYVLVSKLEKRQPSMELGAPPLQTVGSTVMPAATLETIEEIFQTKLHSYTVRLRLRRLEDIERFRLPDGHPLAARVNQLDIPAYPIRAKDAMPTPHLIMDGLAQHGQGVRFLTPHQRNKLQNLIETGAFAMMGVSGSGKTRTIMELLAEMWGLLFVVDTQHNGGIKDFGALASHLQPEIKDPGRRSLSKAPFNLSHVEAIEWAFNEQERIRKDNEPIALHAVTCVLLARLLVLDSFLQHFEEQMNPTTWLWIQLYPAYMLETTDPTMKSIVDTLTDLFKQFIEIPAKVVLKAVEDRMERITARLGLPTKLPCFVDEAQILFTQFSGCFPSHEASLENNIGRSLFSVALRAFSYNVQGPVFAGTGMRLQEATEALASAAMGKHPGSEGRVYADLPSLKGDACVQYLSRYLDLETVAPRDRDAIVRVVSGRARASARYVGEVLIKDNVDLMEVLRFVIDKLTQPAQIHISPKESLYVMLDKLFVKLRTRPEYDLVRATFRRMVATYAITGQPQRFPDNDVDGRVAVQFIEEGICRVSKDTTSGLVAVIDEQLVLIAACNYFNLHSYQWEMLAYSADEPSSLGFQFERSLALLIESGLITLFSSDSPPLEEHPLLKHRLEVPPGFRGKWRLDTSRGPEAGFVIGRAATDDYTLADWIVNPTSVFFFPDKHAGPDIVFFVVNEDGRRALVPLQSKLVNTRLKSSETERAIETTDVTKFYKFGNGKAIATRSQQRAAIMEFYESENVLSIGILLSYPAGAAGAQSMVRYENRDLFIAACGEDFKLLVPPAFAERIAFMKN